MKIRPDQEALPTLQSHTAMASEAVTMKTLGTISLMYDKDDINNTVCFTVPVRSRLGCLEKRRREHTSSRGAELGAGVHTLLVTLQ